MHSVTIYGLSNEQKIYVQFADCIFHRMCSMFGVYESCSVFGVYVLTEILVWLAQGHKYMFFTHF